MYCISFLSSFTFFLLLHYLYFICNLFSFPFLVSGTTIFGWSPMICNKKKCCSLTFAPGCHLKLFQLKKNTWQIKIILVCAHSYLLFSFCYNRFEHTVAIWPWKKQYIKTFIKKVYTCYHRQNLKIKQYLYPAIKWIVPMAALIQF